MDSILVLQRGSTRLEIARPDVPEPYYRGTRFDRAGIILALESRGHRYISQWFRSYDPWKHDAVGGPAEEFTQIGYEAGSPGDGFMEAGETDAGFLKPGTEAAKSGSSSLRPDTEAAKRGESFLKIGVGLLKREDAPYDRFHLYEVLDPGRTTVRAGTAYATFRQLLKGYYDYSKAVRIPSDGTLRISHRFRNTGPSTLDFHVYSHNFFILDGAPTGRATRFRFPFAPEGHWRAEYNSVALVPDGIAFSRDLREGETVFMGDLHAAADGRPAPGDGYRFTLENLDNGLRARAACDRPMDYAVFWSNTEVACIEPYIRFSVPPGETVRWTLDYRFE